MNKVRYWKIWHVADTTETGYTMFMDYVLTQWDGSPMQQSCEREILRDWCRDRYGKEVKYVQGVAPCHNWMIMESTKDEFQQAPPKMWGGVPSGAPHRISLSFGDHGRVEILGEEEAP